jgi:uroporphyrinogen decarboxylase
MSTAPLTSRERVARAISHQEPDRVPVDFNPVLDAYRSVKAYLGIELDDELRPNAHMEVIPHPRVLRALGADLISVKLGSPTGWQPAALADGVRLDEWGIGRRMVPQPGGGSYMEAVYHPLADATLDDLEKYPWPVPDLPGRGEAAAADARRLFEDTDLAIIGRFGGPIIETALQMMGFEKWLMCTVTDPEFAGALLDKITDIQIKLDRIGLEAAGNYLQIFKASGDDLGMQTGPLYSPKTVRNLFLPRLRRRWLAARAYLDQVNPEVKLLFHSCGSVRAFLPALLEIGLQILDPVQPRAAHMEPAALKSDFGDQLTFHGAVDEQHVLPFGTEADVEREVRARIAELAPGGGYIVCPSHYIQADTPPANVVAMCRAAERYGRYPLEAAVVLNEPAEG